MSRYYYKDSISGFLKKDTDSIFGSLSANSEFSDELTQKSAWTVQIEILKNCLEKYNGCILFEFTIPRMGKRVDVVVIINNVVFVMEFKVGSSKYSLHGADQVWDYCLDLKYFHDESQDVYLAPIHVVPNASQYNYTIEETQSYDKMYLPINCNSEQLIEIIDQVLGYTTTENINTEKWVEGRYSPSPTIIEAAQVLYNKHNVTDIYRKDASALKIDTTKEKINNIILHSRKNGKKSICFITGVPGAGKTLVGLDIASQHLNSSDKSVSVFLSGNGPLVSILREALARDRVNIEKQKGKKLKVSQARTTVKAFIQNVHNFRDTYLKDKTAPADHLAIFDEAQRAWNLQQTVNFMKQKKGQADFKESEPEYLISCMDRHSDWAVIVCLVGGGQEINTGEAGIKEWIESIGRRFDKWEVYISSKLIDSEYNCENEIENIKKSNKVFLTDDLHLSVSLRSFRAEKLSTIVKNALDLNVNDAKREYENIKKRYPIVLTRNIEDAKKWLRKNARANERFGIVASAQAQRLKPFAINVKSTINPIHWFLSDKEDIRSSYYLEDVATEFQVQGLELDWACVSWDGDLRLTDSEWGYYSFKGKKWKNILKEERKKYLKNAYRVLLTRARQGMVIFIPEGSKIDKTRKREYYDGTFEYLKSIGFDVI
jgi:hypothetical protein